MNAPIYLDYAATTPADPRVAETMARYLTLDGVFANPASRSHMPGWQAEQAVEGARRQVADLIGADPREIVWTSGATEADNLALIGFMRANRHRGNHLVTSTIEHKAVVDTAQALEREGVEVTWLEPGHDGRIAPTRLAAAMRDDTVLVSLMAVNNELGTINDLAALSAVVHARDAVFHVDAAQAVGRIPLDVVDLGIDLMSLSGHKAYGPKGVGALYVRRSPDIRLEALIHGGGHERGMRSGTLPTHQIVGMGEAFALAEAEGEADQARIATLAQRFLTGLDDLQGVHRNTDVGVAVPNIVNLSFDGVDGESLLMALRGIAVSTGSACNSASVEPSYVLKGIGVPRARALTALRFSFGRFTDEADIDTAVADIRHAITTLRG
ncbi:MULTISPECIES: aminotransferase class V-fold PLP-dependent enzyme [unclassified Modicisalibacter]|uniref:aminotransferase class V-fold PLP-dependent enzyme n=1 Tax=unclassified Modicisalibacter TaxID=2679913 RepID=UPI001CCCC53F|nr:MULTISPECIES: aminotransferase class V-fold PLP-dependent enzyme [unclassified Modicisalibacter]MBZ9559565.1 aminotransferase class V-fold PLP-dependent enzyme [Modicisalibacter sp. R2A 31.J]MBZ9577017.1 aminotransferase class V-fold PLP-dependent enzyme [Modicisalibacter sp. MOD 31.J]